MTVHMGYARSRNLGAIFWVLSIQYYVVQVVVAEFWAKSNGYNWARNTISDLANTRCGLYGSRLVCSPLHTAMNVSFVVLGSTMVGGAYLLQRQLAADKRRAKLGFGCMAVAGVGTIMVGLFPENAVSLAHILGAALSFIFGNLGMITIGLALTRLPNVLRAYTILSGMIGLAALVLFMANTYLGLGIGGMERIVAYPQSIWMMVLGAYLLLRDMPLAP